MSEEELLANLSPLSPRDRIAWAKEYLEAEDYEYWLNEFLEAKIQSILDSHNV